MRKPINILTAATRNASKRVEMAGGRDSLLRPACSISSIKTVPSNREPNRQKKASGKGLITNGILTT